MSELAARRARRTSRLLVNTATLNHISTRRTPAGPHLHAPSLANALAVRIPRCRCRTRHVSASLECDGPTPAISHLASTGYNVCAGASSRRPRWSWGPRDRAIPAGNVRPTTVAGGGHLRSLPNQWIRRPFPSPSPPAAPAAPTLTATKQVATRAGRRARPPERPATIPMVRDI